MTAVLESVQAELTVADILARFGPIPIRRIRLEPTPGTATESDVVAIWEHEKRLCELVDGILVEKDVGAYESMVAMRLGQLLGYFLRGKRLGVVFGADGMMLLNPGLIRIPDVSYDSKQRLRIAKIQPLGPLVPLVPEIAAEVISRGNTREEMDEKLTDYFDAGVQLVWMIHPLRQEVSVFEAADRSRIIRHPQPLDGGNVLPGLSISLEALFAPATDDED